ncbi:hypothetical protein CUMW_076360 [Citrus unshiu]|nr:hypothetical protein CUMW_076360 [Citrus unshiu]
MFCSQFKHVDLLVCWAKCKRGGGKRFDIFPASSLLYDLAGDLMMSGYSTMLVQTCCLEMVPGDGGMFTHAPCGMSLDAEFCLTTFK